LTKKIILFFLIILIVSAGGLSFYIYKSLETTTRSFDGKTEITVHKGESLYSILDRLQEVGLIHDKRIYKVYSRFIHSFTVKSGFYSLSPGLSGMEILKVLEEGKQELIKITIPEGLTAISSRELRDDLNIPADTAEGYLFPDTYFFQKNFLPDKVVEYMVKTYFENLEDIFPFYKDLSDSKLQEKLIIASIVEKEYRVEIEAPLIASVFYNRLKIGMPLQSCATVIYVITEELGKSHPERVLFRDLEIPSEFNTYVNSSLPPAPISNPGKTALKAAFDPAQTDFLFFVVKDSLAGTHNFTSTLADHNSARQSYIQGFRSK
jgi:UPF0755 protein